MNIEETIIAYIRRELLNDDPGVTLNPETKLIEEGMIDSVSLMELVLFLEATFNVSITEEELVAENFQTIRAISQFIAQKRK
jgi:acyl carrier protein